MMPLVIIFAVLGAALVWWLVRGVAARAIDTCCETGDWHRALAWIDRASSWRMLPRAVLGDARALALQALGDVDGAVACARAGLALPAAGSVLLRANTAVDVLVFAGLYEEALAVTAGWDAQRWTELRSSAPIFVILRVNLAEALYNQGKWSEALASLADLDAVADHPLAAAILAMQRGWILAHQGDGERALQIIDRADRAVLPPAWRSEAHYTRAVALLAIGRVDQAKLEAEAGLAVARRASSQRNGWFLLAHVAVGEGALDRACELFERGADCAYQRQGGASLVAWGNVLARLGHERAARTAWQLAIERDPESEAAMVASKHGLVTASMIASIRHGSLQSRRLQ